MAERACMVAGCEAAASDVRPICKDHFASLPGRTRSRPALSAGLARSPRTAAAFEAAVTELSR